MAGVSGVVMYSVSTRTNRLEIGVRDEAAKEQLAIKLRDLGVPEAAVIFQNATFEFDEDETLAARTQHLRGGILIGTPSGSGYSGCTLGAVGTALPSSNLWPDRFFLTAAHCSSRAHMVTTSDYYTQPNSAGGTIGAEYADGRIWPHAPAYIYVHPCFYPEGCQESDVNMIKWNGTRFPPQSGSIARTTAFSPNTSVTTLYGSGNNWYVEELGSSYAGSQVNMVGALSGWTQGSVTHSCVSLFVAARGSTPAYWLNCMNAASYPSQDGDSGAPVFTNDLYPILVGIHSGRIEYDGGSRAVFSPISKAEFDLPQMQNISWVF